MWIVRVNWTASRIFFLLATLYLITSCPGVVLCRTNVPKPRLCFEKYGVLGDDVVIADQKVAEVYKQSLKELGVDIFYQKSLISSTGCAEFAKRFRVRGLTRDLSSVSFKSLLNLLTTLIDRQNPTLSTPFDTNAKRRSIPVRRNQLSTKPFFFFCNRIVSRNRSHDHQSNIKVPVIIGKVITTIP
ncbi:hypothetical protein M9H77_04490 [Catharanthus roseus]|uniref:Uncharacterized protein n=1 Tax=Catharanthus roseus TaxID=4058 RepID=A0ACC0CEJ5_CATRO|nr:hypothetical protein M9H77_04490 [Catharanthus roseus]